MATNPDPSPAEIAELCSLIQSTWTPQERMKRLRADLRPTYTRCDGETEEMAADVYNGHHGQREKLQEIIR